MHQVNCAIPVHKEGNRRNVLTFGKKDGLEKKRRSVKNLSALSKHQMSNNQLPSFDSRFDKIDNQSYQRTASKKDPLSNIRRSPFVVVNDIDFPLHGLSTGRDNL